MTATQHNDEFCGETRHNQSMTVTQHDDEFCGEIRHNQSMTATQHDDGFCGETRHNQSMTATQHDDEFCGEIRHNQSMTATQHDDEFCGETRHNQSMTATQHDDEFFGKKRHDQSMTAIQHNDEFFGKKRHDTSTPHKSGKRCRRRSEDKIHASSENGKCNQVYIMISNLVQITRFMQFIILYNNQLWIKPNVVVDLNIMNEVTSGILDIDKVSSFTFIIDGFKQSDFMIVSYCIRF